VHPLAIFVAMEQQTGEKWYGIIQDLYGPGMVESAEADL